MGEHPIDIRGHHLRSIGIDIDMKTLGKLLVKWGYINEETHSFVRENYDFFKGLRENPRQLITPITMEKDYICSICPILEKCKSFPNQQAKYSWGAFIDKDYPSSEDTKLIKMAGLKIGEPYAVEEIVRATKGQANTLKRHLRL